MFSKASSESLDIRALFNSSPNAYVIFDPDLVIVGCNAAYLAAVGRASGDEIVGRKVFEAFPSPAESVSYRLLRRSLEKVLETHERDHIAVIPYDTSQPGEAPNMRYWSATHTPIFDESGVFRYILQHTVDVTELQLLRERDGRETIAEAGVLARARAVQADKDAIDTERQLLREMFRQAPGFIGILAGPAHTFLLANDAYMALTGGRELEGHPVAEALPEVVGQGFLGLLDSVYRSGQPYVGRNVEVVLQQPGEEEPDVRFVDFVYQPMFGEDGKVGGIFVQGHDVTDKVRQEQAQALHRRELAHRLKNQLAMTQAIVNQSLRSSSDLPSARQAIAARLQALANAHDSLVSGLVGKTTVSRIVDKTLSVYDDRDSGRFAIEGPEVEIGSQPALSLSLILHELLTNAMKYGALSSDRGAVRLSWGVKRHAEGAPRFALRWIESDGPPVAGSNPPGAGSRLIRAGLSGVLDSSVTLDFLEAGVVCEIEADLGSLADADA